MRKFLYDGLLFVGFVAIVYSIFLILFVEFIPPVFRPNVRYKVGSYGHLRTRVLDLRNYHDVDILFLGSSHAYRGFDTRIFDGYGFKTFNLGSSSQTPIQTKILLTRYLDSINPKLVVFEAYPESFALDGVESAIDLIANDRNDLLSIDMACKIQSVKTYNTLLYGIIVDLVGRYKRYQEPLIKGEDTYVSGGFVEKNVTATYSPIKFEPRNILFKDYQLSAFSDIVKLLRDRGIDLILAYAPIARSYYESYSDHEGFDSLMSSYSRYYNFNEIMKLDDTLFYDYHHMNQRGVEIFNREFIQTALHRR